MIDEYIFRKLERKRPLGRPVCRWKDKAVPVTGRGGL
jgi:hypothetical protein